MKAVLHYRAGRTLRDRIATFVSEGIDIVAVDESDDERFYREIAEAEVLLHVLQPVTAAMIAAAPNLRLIQKIGVGLNAIDRRAAAARGVKVANMPGINSQAVAEHTLALMLAVLRRIVVLDGATRAGRGWLLPPELLEDSGEIAGRTVGLVGFGTISRRLAPVLRVLGATVIYTRRSESEDVSEGYRSLDALLREADVVSLHLPLDASSRHIIDATALSLMKSSAVLVNTARGELVDEAALIAALREGRLRGAGLDVFTEEPAMISNPLFDMSSVVVSPHIAWLTLETIDRSLSIAIENCFRIMANKPILNEAPYLKDTA